MIQHSRNNSAEKFGHSRGLSESSTNKGLSHFSKNYDKLSTVLQTMMRNQSVMTSLPGANTLGGGREKTMETVARGRVSVIHKEDKKEDGIDEEPAQTIIETIDENEKDYEMSNH